jgi:hypothetical protein
MRTPNELMRTLIDLKRASNELMCAMIGLMHTFIQLMSALNEFMCASIELMRADIQLMRQLMISSNN